MGYFEELTVAIVGGGLFGMFIMYLINRGKQSQVIEDHCEEINDLRKEQDAMKDRMNALEQSTAIRLATIETELKNLSVIIVDLSKDVKSILKKHIWEG